MKLRLIGERDVLDPDGTYSGPGVFDVPDEKAERFLEQSFWGEVDEDEETSEETSEETEAEIDGDGEETEDADDGGQVGEELGDGGEPEVTEEPDEDDKIAQALAEVRAEKAEEAEESTSTEGVRSGVIETMDIDYSEDEESAPPVDLSDYLTANATPLRDAINDGDFDDDLDTMISIETSTQDRKTVKDALRSRKQELGGYK